MELAGLACAQALASAFDKESHKRVLVITGPGNQVGKVTSVRFVTVWLTLREIVIREEMGLSLLGT